MIRLWKPDSSGERLTLKKCCVGFQLTGSEYLQSGFLGTHSALLCISSCMLQGGNVKPCLHLGSFKQSRGLGPLCCCCATAGPPPVTHKWPSPQGACACIQTVESVCACIQTERHRCCAQQQSHHQQLPSGLLLRVRMHTDLIITCAYKQRHT